MRGREWEEGEKHQYEREILISPSASTPTGTEHGTHNPGTCPEQESDWQLSGLWDDAQPTEPH